MREQYNFIELWLKEDLLPGSIRNHLLTVAHNTRNYWVMAFEQVYIDIENIIKGKLFSHHF